MTPRASAVEALVEEVAEVVRPRLRGWLHLGTFPLALLAGVVLVAMAPDGRARSACAVYAVTSVLLFGVSAAYHRGSWTPRTRRLLKRLDHSNIYLLVAGTYTPFAALALPEPQRSVLLWVVWSGAAAGVLFRVLRPDAPRWLYVPLYAVLGWIAVFFMPALIAGAGTFAMGSSSAEGSSTPRAASSMACSARTPGRARGGTTSGSTPPRSARGPFTTSLSRSLCNGQGEGARLAPPDLL